MDKAKKTKISNYVSRKTWETVILRITEMPGIKRDELLNHWLKNITPELREMPSNNLTKTEFQFWAGEFMPDDKVKINITLDKQVLAELDEILIEKNMPRGPFISAFLDSLDDSLIELEFRLNNPFTDLPLRGLPQYTQIFPSNENIELIRSFTKHGMTEKDIESINPDDL